MQNIQSIQNILKIYTIYNTVVDESKHQKNPRLRKIQFLEICTTSRRAGRDEYRFSE